MNARTKQRIHHLERLATAPCSEFADQMVYAAMEALDLKNLEYLVRFMMRGAKLSDATPEEQMAFGKYSEVYQAEAVRASGETWSALVRSGLVYRTAAIPERLA